MECLGNVKCWVWSAITWDSFPSLSPLWKICQLLPRVEELLLSLQLGLLTRQVFTVLIGRSGPHMPIETGAQSLASGPVDRDLGVLMRCWLLQSAPLGINLPSIPQTPLPRQALPGPSTHIAKPWGCSLICDWSSSRTWASSPNLFSWAWHHHPPWHWRHLDYHLHWPITYEIVWIVFLYHSCLYHHCSGLGCLALPSSIVFVSWPLLASSLLSM